MARRGADTSIAERMTRRAFLRLAGAGATFTVLPAATSLLLADRAMAVTKTYQESQTFFPNPERGWFVSIEPDYRDNTTIDHDPPDFPDEALTQEKLREHRAKGITLVRKYYLLYPYRGSDIPQSYLDEHPIFDLNLMRQSGFKLIPRFLYTWSPEIDLGIDATVNWILRHLDQLAPILQANADVISHMEMGFVGRAGEWNSSGSQNVGPGPGNPSGEWTNPVNGAVYVNALNDNSRAIIDKVLDVLPQKRMVLMRGISHLQQLYVEPLAEQQAYGGSDQARLGLHDDSVMYNEVHRGGYYYRADIRQQERDYQEQSTKYVVMSGEPSGVDSKGHLLKSDPFVEFGKMHWRCLNEGWYEAIRDGVYDYWKDRGAYDEIGMRLGYRFSLVSATVKDKVRPRGTFTITASVKNSGFGTPHNQRPVEVILRHGSTQQEYFVRANADPRKWWSGQTTGVTVSARVPSSMPTGNYSVFLNLPNSETSLNRRPGYSIRFANDNVWETSTGYNRLGATVNVSGETVSNPNLNIPAFARRTDPPSSSEETITLTSASPNPKSAPMPKLTAEENDVLISFDDHPGQNYDQIQSSYGGVDWSGGDWRLAADGWGKSLFIYSIGSTIAQAVFRLPQGKVLKSFMLHKYVRDGSLNKITLRSGNKEYVWDNPAPWWAHHVFLEDWYDATNEVNVTLESDSSYGGENFCIGNIVYGDPSPPVKVTFEELSEGAVLTGMHGGIDWGTDRIWRVGIHSDGSKFIYVDKSLLPQGEWRDKKTYFALPDGMFLKTMEMRKRVGEDENGDRVLFTAIPPEDENPQRFEYSLESVNWIPIGHWQELGFGYVDPWGDVGMRFLSAGATSHDISNVLIRSVTYRRVVRVSR